MAKEFIKPQRVAIASSDGKVVDECFGRARYYRIYALAAAGYQPAEVRESPRPCRDGAHEEDNFAAALSMVADCQMVVAGRIGPEAVRRLEERGIFAAVVALPLEKVLQRLFERGLPPLSAAVFM
ncbi:MAG: hypothetical protein LBP75_05000 [Planctomycetota bacterium]|jgi:predicted Fe-Mo cluster-binding NifX family protein|nr:hypothetical protein [Planctomycetota bacterium]